jgi:signal transduction histidine kinase
MTLGANLATRITLLLLCAFVLIQLVILGALALPGRGNIDRPYNLPPPGELATIVRTIETTPPSQRPALLTALNGSLYTMRLLPNAPQRDGDLDAPDLAAARAAYAAALPRHRVWIEGRPGPLSRAIRQRPGPMRYFSPIQIGISPVGGDVLILDSRPSALVRNYLRQRASQGLVGALVVLAALGFAIRQTTRPIVRMSERVRHFGTELSMPDLEPSGSRELRQLAEAFNEMKGRIAELVADRTRMLAAIAHDMRTYLTRLRLRAEFIEDPEQRKKAVADIAEMGALLEDTLLFAGQNERQAVHHRIDLLAELSEIVSLRIEMGDAVGLAADTAEGALIIKADALALRRMMANLIDNGLRHGSEVTVTVERAGGEIRIIVRDNGPGVPDEALAKLGEPYTRLDPSRDRASGGAGLGLAIVRALAGQNGGSLRFENRVPHGLEATLAFGAR